MKPIALVPVILTFLFVGHSQYNTNPNRSEGVQQLCLNNNLDRGTLLEEEDKLRNQQYKAGIDAAFSVNGSSLITNILNNPANIATQITSTATQLLIYIAPFAVGTVSICFIWMFLCCCCACPGCCPSRCCRKNQNQQYTKCELIWPTVVLILALLLAAVSSIVGLTKASDFQTSVKKTGCAFAITFDDLLNGNTSQSGNFFAGISTITLQLANLNENLNFISTQLDTIDNDGSAITGVTSSFATFESDLSELSAGNANPDTNHANITYGPFISGGSTVNSVMPSILGRKSASNSSIGATFSISKSTKDLVVSTSDAAQSFKNGIGSFSTGFSNVEDTLSTLLETLKEVDGSITSGIGSINNNLGDITIAISSLFGVVIGLSFLGIFGALLMTFCNKFKCRYLVYFACIFLFLLGVILFVVSTIFATLTPLIYYSCQFLTYSTESSQNFKNSLSGVLGDATDYIGICLSGSSGNLLETVGSDLISSIDGLTGAMEGMKQFDDSQFSTAIDQAWRNVTTTLNNYYTGKTLDFQLAQGKQQLIKLSDHTQWECNEANFAVESWVPTIQLDAAISCAFSNVTKLNTCSDIGDPSICTPACYDTQQILIAAAGSVSTKLNSRYSDLSCASFKTALQLVYSNFYAIKAASAGYGDLLSRFNAMDSGSKVSFSASVNTVQSTFVDVYGNLTQKIDSIVNPQYGLIAGFNCVLFGEDFNRFIETLCISFFNTAYLARLTVGITAFGILFAMCCSVCAGVRHFKHSVRVNKIGVDENYQDQDHSFSNLNQDSSFTKLKMKEEVLFTRRKRKY